MGFASIKSWLHPPYGATELLFRKLDRKAMSSPRFEMIRAVLKPPVHLLAITFGEERPAKPQHDIEFATLEEAYAFFRKEKPQGQWTVWLKGSGGQEIGVDSQLWEKAMGKTVKG